MFGVEDTAKAVVGIPFERIDVAEIFARDLCNDVVEPPLNAVIEKLYLPDGEGVEVAVLKVEVPRSLFVHRSPGGYFHRVGSSKRQMSPDYLARLFQQRSQARLIRFDEQDVPGATLDMLEEALWKRFQGELAPNEPRDSLLEKLRMARHDANGVLRPTVAGVLMAHRDPRAFLPNAFVQAVAYRGVEAAPDQSKDLYQLDARDLSGPLDQQIVAALDFVNRNMKVSAFKEIGRRDVPQYDLTAVFEALVNAVVHRDYSIYGSKVRLRMYSDRLEICSPGPLPNSMTIDSLPLLTAARNEVLGSLLARCAVPTTGGGVQTLRRTFMDRRGEGVSVILKLSEQLSGRWPEYRVIDEAEVQLTIWAAQPVSQPVVADAMNNTPNSV